MCKVAARGKWQLLYSITSGNRDVFQSRINPTVRYEALNSNNQAKLCESFARVDTRKE
jgi:hypothetical protein